MEKTLQTRYAEGRQEIVQALNAILEKDDGQLTNEERGFLRARRTYLTSDEIARFPSALVAIQDPPIKPEAATDESSSVPPNGQLPNDSGDTTESLFPDKEYKDLQRMASEAGMEKVVGKSRRELEEFLISKM